MIYKTILYYEFTFLFFVLFAIIFYELIRTYSDFSEILRKKQYNGGPVGVRRVTDLATPPLVLFYYSELRIRHLFRLSRS